MMPRRWAYWVGVACLIIQGAGCAHQVEQGEAGDVEPPGRAAFVEPLADAPRTLLRVQRTAAPQFAIHQDGPLLSGLSARHRFAAQSNFEGVDLTVGEDRTALALRLTGVGRGDVRGAPISVAPVARDGAAWYDRPVVSSWYRNPPLWLQQGFVVHEAPKGDLPGEITLEVAVEGDYRVEGEGRSVRLLGPTSMAYRHG